MFCLHTCKMCEKVPFCKSDHIIMLYAFVHLSFKISRQWEEPSVERTKTALLVYMV